MDEFQSIIEKLETLMMYGIRISGYMNLIIPVIAGNVVYIKFSPLTQILIQLLTT